MTDDFTGFFVVEVRPLKVEGRSFFIGMEITEKYGEPGLKFGVEETFPFDQIKLSSFIHSVSTF